MPVGTTTTTLPVAGCAQPVTSGSRPSASDCLFILRVAVFVATCEPACICDPDASGLTSAVDALICLKAAVGQQVPLQCPCESATTTTSMSPSATSRAAR
jgi:hypothetical protein